MLKVIIKLMFTMTRKVMQDRYKINIFDRSKSRF